jgi:hypothetical protein
MHNVCFKTRATLPHRLVARYAAMAPFRPDAMYSCIVSNIDATFVARCVAFAL